MNEKEGNKRWACEVTHSAPEIARIRPVLSSKFETHNMRKTIWRWEKNRKEDFFSFCVDEAQAQILTLRSWS